MKQVLLKEGTIYSTEIASPKCEKGMILVKTEFSCISAGTEMSGVVSSGDTIIKKILDNPELIMLGLNMLKERGIKDTWTAVTGGYSLGSAMGYSAAGVVIESGSELFEIGDRVACMGVGYANHAGYIVAPQNLATKTPNNVLSEHASTAALGCIAMQGIRRADVKLGEWIVIEGMGILGQLSARLAIAAGANVIVTDIDERRLQIAKENGVDYAIHAGGDVVEEVNQITGGHGADSVIITASTNSDKLISQSFQMCRRKGKVVLVGVAGMNLKREDMYRKELDFLISTSYGPGRYDNQYEEKGLDYPYSYVRFTEKRNLESYLNLMATGKIDITDMIEGIFPVEKASEAYQALSKEEHKPLILLIQYKEESNVTNDFVISNKTSYTMPKDVVKVALCGAGAFAQGMHLPNIKKLKDKYQLYAVQSRTGANAQAIALANGAAYSTTSYQKILSDPEVDMIMICTRHHLHAEMIIQALKAKKAVFVEKPMALNQEECDAVLATAKEMNVPFLVGFNRRFSKYMKEVKHITENRKNPMIISYRMNAGYIPLDHWTQAEEGGGRIIGEACHIFDLFNYLTGAKAESISVNHISPKTDHVLGSDNCVITVKYEDGSICTLTYTGQGSKDYGKEYCEVFFDGKVIVVDDYKSLKGYGVKANEIKTLVSEKGQLEELEYFYQTLKEGNQYPIPLWQLEQATKISFLAM